MGTWPQVFGAIEGLGVLRVICFILGVLFGTIFNGKNGTMGYCLFFFGPLSTPKKVILGSKHAVFVNVVVFFWGRWTPEMVHPW